MSPSGQVLASYSVQSGNNFLIPTAADGTMWFAGFQGRISQITIAGNVSEAGIPDPNTFPIGIAIRKSDGMVLLFSKRQ
ncbi:MAG: hypothetical protein ABIS68_08895 [Casimicrobiaceae bacterium]